MHLKKLSYIKLNRLIILFFILSLRIVVFGQESLKYIFVDFKSGEQNSKIDLLRSKSNVVPFGDPIELATLLAVSYYPELKGNTIQIKYKKNVRYPITASWAFGNIFKSRKNHTYVLLLSPQSFANRVSLNKQVGVVGHEMAHFVYYKQHPSIHMLWWGLKPYFKKVSLQV